MNAIDFFKEEDPENNDNYSKEVDNWLYDKNDMVLFAERYHQAKLKVLGIADASGLACKCGNQIFTHRHSNWIECTACNKIQVLQA